MILGPMKSTAKLPMISIKHGFHPEGQTLRSLFSKAQWNLLSTMELKNRASKDFSSWLIILQTAIIQLMCRNIRGGQCLYQVPGFHKEGQCGSLIDYVTILFASHHLHSDVCPLAVQSHLQVTVPWLTIVPCTFLSTDQNLYYSCMYNIKSPGSAFQQLV